ncbi:hypothetical protein ACIQZO_12705 [Streptomyces sp. NPDC097617]|uniref:hypothetical protein n=1 Tax=Streptomyces sp. NPDC097617 TaxID=3366091 RepID=UPI003828AB6E
MIGTPADANCEVPHRLLRKSVRDIGSGTEGTLMAVVVENTAAAPAYEDRWVEIAYIRPHGGGFELSTAAANVEPTS